MWAKADLASVAREASAVLGRTVRRLIRYVGRPPLANDRLQKLDDGRVMVRFKRPWNDGTSAVIFDGVTLLERLAALVPQPRSHRVVYTGVFASAAAWRSEVVPEPPAEAERRALHPPCRPPPEKPTPRRWIPWADLLWRVFQVPDALDCPRCGHRMVVHAVLQGFWVTRRVLASLKLPHALPVAAPSRAPPLFAIA